MQSLRSLREQAERVAVAEVKCQKEVECQTNVLKEKVASQAQIITELSEQLSACQRSSEARVSLLVVVFRAAGPCAKLQVHAHLIFSGTL
jgi:uncharacterized coiled-coil protein SlyX